MTAQPSPPSGGPPAPPPQLPPHHGPPLSYGYPGGVPYPQPSNGMAIAGGVLGIVGLLLFWFFFVGAVVGVLAIIFSVIGIRTADRLPYAPHKGFAVAGLVCGIVAVALQVALLVLLLVHFTVSSGASGIHFG